LHGHTCDRCGDLEGVIRQAWRLDDHALHAQALTALGDELAYEAEVAQACNLYRQAIAALDGSGIPVYKVPAHRRLLEIRERHADHWLN
jgi:hypothetical protein